MYMIRTRTLTRTCNVLPSVVTTVRGAISPVDLQDDISEWCRSPLDNSSRRLCSTQTEDKHISYSTGKTLAQIKKEQNWCYDPTIKYESLRKCTVPRFAYCDDSATDWSDSSASDSEIEPETMTVEEAQTRKDKILAEARKEKPFPDNPLVSYDVLKQFKYVDSPDSFASPPSDPEDTPEEVEARNKKYTDAFLQNIITPSLFKIKVNEYGSVCTSQSETETETEEEEEAQASQDKFLAETKNEQLFRYNPSVKYEPLKRYIVPRFAFFDSSSTDWSASSDFECETEIIVGKESQSQEDKIPAGTKEEQLIGDDLSKSPSTDLHSVAAPSSNFLSKPTVSDPYILVKPGAKCPAEGGDKVLNRANI